MAADDIEAADYHQARALLRRAGLPFPTIPVPLRHRLRRHERWVYATRPLGVWPYRISEYIEEAARRRVPDYALVAHAGYGTNSYAIHYYLVSGALRLFVQMGWGGSYMGPSDVRRMRAAFASCHQIVSAAERLDPSEPVTVMASSFYGATWARPGEPPIDDYCPMRPVQPTLDEVLAWLRAR